MNYDTFDSLLPGHVNELLCQDLGWRFEASLHGEGWWRYVNGRPIQQASSLPNYVGDDGEMLRLLQQFESVEWIKNADGTHYVEIDNWSEADDGGPRGQANAFGHAAALAILRKLRAPRSTPAKQTNPARDNIPLDHPRYKQSSFA